MLAFSTDRYRPPERLDAFHDEFARRVILLDRVWLEDDRPFNGEIELRNIGSLTYARLACSPARFERVRSVDKDDAVMLTVQTKGRFKLQRANMEWDSREDFASLVTDTAPVLGAFGGEAAHIWISETLLAPHLAHGGIANPARIRKHTSLAQLLGSYLQAYLALPVTTDAAIGETVGRHVVELVALALGASSEAKHAIQSSGLRAARRQVILDEINKSFLVPGLSSESVAASVGISERYLRALLDDIGTTFSDVVLEHRLERAHDLLTNPRRRSELITDIAYEAGFSDLSYFNRAFRRRYGATPRDVRAGALKL